MELVCHTAGDESGGKGWRAFFCTGIENGIESKSESASVHSHHMSSAKAKSRGGGSGSTERVKDRPVSRLRPREPVVIQDTATLLEVSKAMAHKRADAALIVTHEGELCGIITDKDLAHRVIANFVDINSPVTTIMTRNPKCVRSEDSALDALEMMVDNKFRHLPVLDSQGAVVGVLDIAKCLYDTLTVLEKVHEQSTGPPVVNATALANAVGALQKAGGAGSKKKQLETIQALLSQVYGGYMPTLEDVVGGSKYIQVRSATNVRETAVLMAKAKKSVLIMEENEVVGIFTPKDLLNRVIAKDKSPDLTAVSSVMTANPDCAFPSMSLLDALHEMYEQKYLHLPVRDSRGRVLGLVDVMELVCHTAGDESGGKGWRAFFGRAINEHADDRSEVSSLCSDHSSKIFVYGAVMRRASKTEEDTSDVFSLGYGNDVGKTPASIAHTGYNYYDSASVMYRSDFAFKVVDSAGQAHRLKCCADSVSGLRTAIGAQLGIAGEELILKYQDDDGDDVAIDSDASLLAAVDFAKSSGLSVLKISHEVRRDAPAPLSVSVTSEQDDASAAVPLTKLPAATSTPVVTDTVEPAKKGSSSGLLIGGLAVLAVAAAGAMVVIRSKK